MVSLKGYVQLNIDEEISLWEIQCYFQVFFVIKDNNLIVDIGYYGSRIKLDNIRFLISDRRVLRNRNFVVTQGIPMFLTY